MLLNPQTQGLFHNYSDSRCEQLTQYQKSCKKVHSLKLNCMCDSVVVDCKITMGHLEYGTPISSQQAHALLLIASRQKPVFSQQSRKK